MKYWKHFLVGVAFAIFCVSMAVPVSAENRYVRSYQTYLYLAKQALGEGRYQKAIFNLEIAAAIDPGRDEPRKLINYIQRLLHGKVVHVDHPSKQKTAPAKIGRSTSKPVTTKPPEKRLSPVTAKAKTTAAQMQRTIPKTISARQPAETKTPAMSYPTRQLYSQPVNRTYAAPATVKEDTTYQPMKGVVFLKDDWWSRQPNTPLYIEIGKTLILDSPTLKRYLMITDGIFTVERVNARQIAITPTQQGFSYFHLWDEHGRWTFNVKALLPQPARRRGVQGDEWTRLGEVHMSPFKFYYNNSWGAFYQGTSLDDLKRDSMTFTQWLGTYGETPYGIFDASGGFYKFQESTELINKTFGVTHGRFGPIEDVNLRVYDLWKKFSDLTLPGRSVRGIMVESYLFDRNLQYSYLTAKDRASFIYYAPGLTDVKKTYIEGGRLLLFPEKENQLALNYVHGWGTDRPSFLKDYVYSVEAKRTIPGFESYYEYARDDNQYGQQAYTHWDGAAHRISISARDLPKDFYTISDQPINQGEAGGILAWNYFPKNSYHIDSNLNLYHDRKLGDSNATEPLNLEFNTNVQVPIDEGKNWGSSLFYDYTPQLLDQRNNFIFANTYSQLFHILGGRELAFFVGHTYQYARFPDTPTSDYDRTSVLAGIRVPIWDRLAYNLQYEYSWVRDIEGEDQSTPTVLTTGLSYTRSLGKLVSTHMSITYRDEENTDNRFSFLSGQDNLRGSVGVAVNPRPGLQFYVDGEVSNIWAEGSDQRAYNEASVYFGVESAWDTPFAWNPTGTVAGTVFKDMNGNAIQDENEPGILDAIVKVGRYEVLTDSAGRYRQKVSAKRVLVVPDMDSLPRGFVFSTPASLAVDIHHSKTETVNFGLTTTSAIYGVVFLDENNNGEHDLGEKGFPGVVIILNQEKKVLTDFEGIYTFDGLNAGPCSIGIDVNSLPKGYLPTIKIQNEIDLTEGTSYIFPIPLRQQ